MAEGGQFGSAIRAMMRDRDGNLWFAPRGGGLVRWRDGEFSRLATGLFADAICGALLEDNEGSLWIGSYGLGLLRLHDGKFVTAGETEGLSGISPGPSSRGVRAASGSARTAASRAT